MRPLKQVNISPGVCSISEFISPDTIDDDIISASSVLQHIPATTFPFAWEHYYAVNNSVTNTTSIVFIPHLVFTPTIVGAGQYELKWSYASSANRTTRDSIVRVEHVGGTQGNAADPSILYSKRLEMKDAAAISRVGGTGTDQEMTGSGFVELTLPAGPQTFNFLVRTFNADTVSSIWDARLSLTRVG